MNSYYLRSSLQESERGRMKSSICRAVALALLAVTAAQCQSLPPVLDLNTDSSLLQGAFVDFLERDGSKTRVVQGTNQLITDPDSTVIQLITVDLIQRPDETTGFERLQLDQSALSETVVMLISSKTYVSSRLTIIGRFSFDQCLDILRAIDYINNSTNPSNSVVRVIQFQIQDDSGASSQPVEVQLGIVPFNNPPELLLGGAGVVNFTTMFTTGGGCVPVISESVRLIDPDSDGIEYVELIPELSTWDASFESLSSQSLSFMPPNRYFLNLTRTSDYESLLPEILYCNTAEEPATGVRRLMVQARDNGSIATNGQFLQPSSSHPSFIFVDVTTISPPTADPVSSFIPRPTDETNGSGCAVSNGGCDHLCVSSEGGHHCECRPGYQLVDGINCLALASCPAQTNLPLFSGSGISYSWTDTAVNSSQHLPCSELRLCQRLAGVSGGMVVRRCVGDDSAAEWLPVDFSGCGVSITALRLCEASQQLASDNEQTAAVLVNITASVPELEVTAITVTTSIVEDLTPAAIDQPEVRGNYLELIDNIIGASPENILESQRHANTSARLFQSLQRFGNEVAMPTNSTNDTLAFALNNFALLLRDVDPRNFSGELFSIDLGAVGEAIQNTAGIDEESLVTMLVPNATASAELPESLFEENVNTARRQRVTFGVFLTNTLFLTPETDCRESAIGSVVLSVGVNSSATNTSLSNARMRLVFRQYREPCDEPLPAQSRAMCANFVREGQYGRWKADGCRVVSDDGVTTRCECAQLGQFGLLFDLNPGDVFAPGAIFLFVVTYIGAAVSILCLLITVVTYSASKKLHSSALNAGIHGQLLINLSCSLIGLYIFFIVAGHVTTVLWLCGVVAALLQYFMLVFFGWTAVEAVFLYQKLVRDVLGQTSPYFVPIAAAIVWVAPAVVVGISAGAGHQFYVNPFYCRATSYPFWFGLILPFLLIYLINWVMFITIIVCLVKDAHRSKRVTPNKKKKFKKHFLLALGLSLVFGLGWGFGLLATSSNVPELTFAFQIIFSIFVGSQGVLIFLFHVVRPSRVRQQWKSWLCCGKRSKSLLVSSPKSPTSPQTSYSPSSPEEPDSFPLTQREEISLNVINMPDSVPPDQRGVPVSATNMAREETAPTSTPQTTSHSVSSGHIEELNSVAVVHSCIAPPLERQRGVTFNTNGQLQN